MRIYEASWDGNYEFRCEVDEDASKELASKSLNLSEVAVCKNWFASVLHISIFF